MKVTGKQYAMIDSIATLMSAEGDPEDKISIARHKHTIGEMLEYFSVGTEREKLVAPKRADPNMLKPIRNLDLRSLSSQAKLKGMGNSKEKCVKIDVVKHDNVPKQFQPDWFDVWISLLALPQFDMRMHDNIGLKLVKIRALPKCEEKGMIYVERMCRDRKNQWVKDFIKQRNRSYDDSYKRQPRKKKKHSVYKQLPHKKNKASATSNDPHIIKKKGSLSLHQTWSLITIWIL